MKINDTLNRNVVIPMFIFVINAKEYDIELIGVVPSVDTMENATPRDMTNKPNVNKHILLIILIYLNVIS